jgi:hypothetical protein
MRPDVWQRAKPWDLLHLTTLNYSPTPENKERIKNFFTNLCLPCDNCTNNFSSHLTKHPLTDEVLSSKENLVKWLIDVHNEVNRMLGKKTMTYEEALQFYVDNYKEEQENNITYWWILIIVILIIAIIFIHKYLL